MAYASLDCVTVAQRESPDNSFQSAEPAAAVLVGVAASHATPLRPATGSVLLLQHSTDHPNASTLSVALVRQLDDALSDTLVDRRARLA